MDFLCFFLTNGINFYMKTKSKNKNRKEKHRTNSKRNEIERKRLCNCDNKQGYLHSSNFFRN